MRVLYHILAWIIALFVIWGCVFVLSECTTIPPDGVSRPPNTGPLPIPKIVDTGDYYQQGRLLQLNYQQCQIELQNNFLNRNRF